MSATDDANPLSSINLFLIITTIACVVCTVSAYQLFLLMKRTWTDPAHALASIALACASVVAYADLVNFFLYNQQTCQGSWFLHAIGTALTVIFFQLTLLVVLRSVFYLEVGPAPWLIGLLIIVLEGVSAGWALLKFPRERKDMPTTMVRICLPQQLSLDYAPLLGLYVCYGLLGSAIIAYGTLRSSKARETSAWTVLAQDGLWYWLGACLWSVVVLPIALVWLDGRYFNILPSTLHWVMGTKFAVEALMGRWRNASSVFGRVAKRMYAHGEKQGGGGGGSNVDANSGITAPPPTPMDAPAAFCAASLVTSVPSSGSGMAIPYPPPVYPPPHLFSASSAAAHLEFDDYSRSPAYPWLSESYPSPPSLKYYSNNTHS